MQIRRASLGDLEALLPLAAAYRVFYEQEADELREREFLSKHLHAGSSVVFLAVNSGRALGFTQLFPTFNTVHLRPALILEDLYVVPEERRAGIGTQLLEAAIAYARDAGAVAMCLETAMENLIAQRVYERNGWIREGHFYKYNAPLG